MAQPDATKWNALYTTEPRRTAPRAAHALLTAHIDLLPAQGLALDVACGTAATGLSLAARGWQVIGLDVAESALRIAQARARQAGLPASFAVLDLADPWLPGSSFDVILDFYFLARPLFGLYRETLKPGGLLFFETFVWQPGIEMNPEHYLQPGELKQAFAGWDILHTEELDRQHGAGNQRRIAQLVARKP